MYLPIYFQGIYYTLLKGNASYKQAGGDVDHNHRPNDKNPFQSSSKHRNGDRWNLEEKVYPILLEPLSAMLKSNQHNILKFS